MPQSKPSLPILLTFTLLSLNFLVPTASQGVFCDPDNRPVTCDDTEIPVCGFLPECDSDVCTRTFSNECLACKDSTIESYVPGICEDMRSLCNPTNRPTMCIDTATAPVCAFMASCTGPDCYKTKRNACEACVNEKVDSYFEVECPKVVRTNIECDVNNRPDICQGEAQPVCANLADCTGTACARNAANPCEACIDRGVASYSVGECPVSDPNKFIECTDIDRSGICADLAWNPVCGHFKLCDGLNCKKSYSNTCEACNDLNVDVYNPGECPDTQKIEQIACVDGNRPEWCDTVDDLVCGYYKDCTGVFCTQRALNGCMACAVDSIGYYIKGDCPQGDKIERFFCNGQDWSDLCTDGNKLAVCAHRKGCIGSGCSSEKETACDACNDATVDYYIVGECE